MKCISIQCKSIQFIAIKFTQHNAMQALQYMNCNAIQPIEMQDIKIHLLSAQRQPSIRAINV